MKENKIIAFCGIDCVVCPEYLCAKPDKGLLHFPAARARLESRQGQEAEGPGT